MQKRTSVKPTYTAPLVLVSLLFVYLLIANFVVNGLSQKITLILSAGAALASLLLVIHLKNRHTTASQKKLTTRIGLVFILLVMLVAVFLIAFVAYLVQALQGTGV